MARKNVTSIGLNDLERRNLLEMTELYKLNMSDVMRFGMWIMFERYLPKENTEEGLRQLIRDEVSKILEETVEN